MAHGFFHDEDIEIPHPPIPLAVFLIVEEAVRVAWHRLKTKETSRIDLLVATEDEITHELYEILFDEVYGNGVVNGFDEERFTIVTREAKLRNFNGKMLDKMPDLLIGLAGREHVYRRSQDWLFVECKPIDSTHSVGVHYAAKGIARFTRGEYAWTMPNALMIGYASRGYEIVPKLVETLRERAVEFHVLDFPVVCAKSRASVSSASSYITRHGRKFTYLETGQAAPPIRLRHLWLSRS